MIPSQNPKHTPSQSRSISSSSQLLQNLVSTEIHQSSLLSERSCPTRRWFHGSSNDDVAFWKLQYQNESQQRQSQLISKHKNLSKSYLKERHQRTVQNGEERWYLILQCKDMLMDVINRHEKRNGGGDGRSATTAEKMISWIDGCNDSLHDALFRAAPARYISKSQFVSTVDRCYSRREGDVMTHPKSSMAKKCNIELVEDLFNSFDHIGKNKIEWRMALYMLHIVCHPKLLLSCRDVLLLGLRYASDVFVAVPKNNCRCEQRGNDGNNVIWRDLKKFWELLLRAEWKDNVLCDCLDSALVRLLLEGERKDNEPHQLSHGQRQRGVDGTIISYEMLKGLLHHETLNDLFMVPIWVGNGNTAFRICRFEERYPWTLLSFVKNKKRQERVKQIVFDRLSRIDTARKRKSLQRWRDFQHRRKWFQRLLRKTFVRYLLLMKYGFLVLHRYALVLIASVEIQRVTRGFLGRCRARRAYILYSSAVLLQSHHRGYVVRRQYQLIVLQRHWAATEIQRRVRGQLSKNLALNKLLTYVGQRQMELERERNAWRHERAVRSAIAIQRPYRRQKAAYNAREKRKRELMASKQMDEERDAYRKERKIIETQIQEYYEQQRIQYFQNNQIVSKNEAEQVKIRTLRRQILNNAARDKQTKDAEEEHNNESKRHEQWTKEWHETIETRLRDYKSYCQKCLTAPDTASEKKMKFDIKKQVKLRVVDVLKRADVKKIPMETPEAVIIATDEVIHLLVEEERQYQLSKMREEGSIIARTQKKTREELERQREQQYERDREYAGLVVSLAIRRWRARKSLREKCMIVYEKIFDEGYGAFYYWNRETNEASWQKPKALGGYDIPASDEWKLLRDSQNFPYYYNPFTMTMSWIVPPGVITCTQVVTYTWWREYPMPTGTCVNFATRKKVEDGECNVEEGVFYCEECWNTRGDNLVGTRFERVNGALADACEIDFKKGEVEIEMLT